MRSYYRLLNRNHRIRKKDDPKLAEAKTLMERMHKLSSKIKGITVSEALRRSPTESGGS